MSNTNDAFTQMTRCMAQLQEIDRSMNHIAAVLHQEETPESLACIDFEHSHARLPTVIISGTDETRWALAALLKAYNLRRKAVVEEAKALCVQVAATA